MSAHNDGKHEREAGAPLTVYRGRTHREKAVLLAVLSHLLLGDGHGLSSLRHGGGRDARAVVLRRDRLGRNVLGRNGRGLEVGHGAVRTRRVRGGSPAVVRVGEGGEPGRCG